jgi:hypothetical protein
LYDLALCTVRSGRDRPLNPRTAAPRHHTLHAALGWSHGLLDAEEQQLFHALGVFSGGFTLDLAVAVGGSEGQDRSAVIDTLAALVEHDNARDALAWARPTRATPCCRRTSNCGATTPSAPQRWQTAPCCGAFASPTSPSAGR